MIYVYIEVMSFAFLAGIVYGVFGGGSGLFLMPAYYFVLKYFNFPNDLQMQMAIATTALSTVFMAIPALIHQKKLNHVDFNIIKKVFWGILTGTLLAVILLNYMPSHLLKIAFGIFVIIVSIWLFLYKQHKDKNKWSLFSYKNYLCTTGIGFIWFSLGVAVFNVPYLLKCGIKIDKAIGSSTFIGSLFSLITGILLMITGYFHIGVSFNHIGFVNLILLGLTIIPSMIGGYFGAKICTALPKDTLRIIYAILVGVIGIIMLI